MELAYQGRNDVGGGEPEVVPRVVKVDGEQKDRVEAVLLAIGLGLDEHHLLGQSVRGVGLLMVAVPEIVLTERDGGELGVGANGSQGDEFSMPPGLTPRG